jgi:spore germination protein KB
MLNNGKFSAFHVGTILYPTVLATGFISLPTITAQYADNDFWLTGLLASLLGMVSVYMATRLYELYPQMTVIQYSEQIMGKAVGKIVGVIYLLFFLHATGVIARQYAEFVTINFLSRTPMVVIISSMLLLTAFAVRGGATMLVRNAVIFTPLFILPLFLLLLLIPDLDVKNIFPVLSHGIIPVLKGTIAPQSWVCEVFLMTFFLPYMSNPEKGRRWGMMSLFAIIIGMTYVNLITLLLLGIDTANKNYPLLSAFRYISSGNFIENLESLLLAMWVIGNFIKISVFYFAAVQSFGQILQLSDYRPFVFPMGILVMVFSLWDIPDFARLGIHLSRVAPFEILLTLVAIPLLLLIIAVLFRRRKVASEGEPSI